MLHNKHFYAVIIGSEILQNRRSDAHFSFLRDALLERNYELYSVQMIKDEPQLITQTFSQIFSDPKAVLFSFGGIGSTPDDLTRNIAAEVFTGQPTQRHKKFESDIIERFGDAAYPFRIHMSDIPRGSELLYNVVNNMSGFHLNGRYFFMPGFPEMAHPMVHEALNTFYPKQDKPFKYSVEIYTSEDKLIPFMQTIHNSIELSCLPMMKNGKPQAELTFQTLNENSLQETIGLLLDYIDEHAFSYKVLE